ncbi:7SK snRNA methylphosphate capping enzyme bin3-like [Pararge aegeria]|uniref:RNA methyltransferase n=3 Tax=Pararge aegeria TaxID=116150 RepID=A0A8S4S8P3_9NEOP|nr:7SK snRNA methylphosphate capping enzyme bin3-like [Pararge aegeria]CAH2251014.1 jg11787 [Pararge aegeria aegeria]
MGSSEENVLTIDSKQENENAENDAGDNSENEVTDTTDLSLNVSVASNPSATDGNTSKEGEASGAGSSKKTKKKFRHGKKCHIPSKDNLERSAVRRLHHPGTKFKQSKKRAQSFPSISKYFLPNKRPRKETFIPPTKFLLGGNISDPLNLNSLQDENVNRAMNAVTPESSPLPTPPRHKAKIDVIIPPNIRDPLNLMEPLDNDEYEKRLEMQQRKPRKKPRIRRRTTETNANINTNVPMVEDKPDKDEGIKEPLPPEPSTSKSRKRSCSDSDNSSLKGKDCKKLRRMDSLDKIVSPVVPQPGAWMRARPQQRTVPPERPASPHRTKLKSTSEEDRKMPTFHPKNSRFQYGNYDRYYGYRNLNAMMDIRLQVFEMHRHLFQNKDVLDIGCNVGHISIAVARTLGAKSVVGIDIDPGLIGRARNSLRSLIPVPLEQPKTEDEKKTDVDDKKSECDKCKDEKCEDCTTADHKPDKEDDPKKNPTGRKLRKPRKNRKSINKQEQGQCFFPMSMSMMFGPIGEPKTDVSTIGFPFNVTFRQGNYVPREDIAAGTGMESPQFDLILCLSTTKWLHLNWGDAGLKRAFRRMFADLRPGGKLVLEAQNWASYKKKKRLTPTIYENFNSIEFFPNKFREYLLSPEVGFSKCCILGVPQHASKGFRRPIQLYVKGDFTPSKACWSDAYAPSSHHRPEAEPPRRTVYAPVAPAYRPSDDAPSCGAVTPYSPNLDCSADDSPFYNPRSDTYAPSYQPPRPTVYATLPSPLGSASPAPSPAASPAPPAPEPVSARGFAAPERPHDD